MGFYIFPKFFLVAVFFKCIALVLFLHACSTLKIFGISWPLLQNGYLFNWNRKYLLAANDSAYEYFNHRKLGRTPIQLSLKRYLMVLGSLLSPRRFRWPFLKSMWPVERKSFVKSCLVNGWVGCFSIPQNIQDVNLCLWVNGFCSSWGSFQWKVWSNEGYVPVDGVGWLRYVYEK